MNTVELRKTTATGHERNQCYNLMYLGNKYLLSFYKDGEESDSWFVQVSGINNQRIDCKAIYYPESTVQIAAYPTVKSMVSEIMKYAEKGTLLIEDFWYGC